jgi:ketosteroid isomerase-like protein
LRQRMGDSTMGDNSEVIRRYREAVQTGDISSMSGLIDEYAADDFVQEWPQSGERINRENSKKLNEQYAEQTGTSPKFEVQNIREVGDLAVIEGVIDYGNGVPVRYVGLAEFRDGKVARVTEYFADPFEAPAWRAPFVEQMAAVGDVT